MNRHLTSVLSALKQYKHHRYSGAEIVLTGEHLDLATIIAVSNRHFKRIKISEKCKKDMTANVNYLTKILDEGSVIYGVNTGYGGSADVRCADTDAMQVSLVEHLNCGYGRCLDDKVVRAVMLVRANSLSRAYSGVRPSTVQLLVDMLNADIIPRVPLRGSISSSGDLMPTSYIAAAMMARSDCKVTHKGKVSTAPEALKSSNLSPIKFQSKEALAVVNAASFASSLASKVLFSSDVAVLLTQLATCMAIEAMNGRLESFNPIISECMPHDGFKEASRNMTELLLNSKLTEQKLTFECPDDPERLKQDRYCLRSAGQWLAPVLETLVASKRRVEVEINSANDNPLVDHQREQIIHCANFQGISTTVAMDQARQSIQLCGKLLFAQFEELVNVNLNVGLSPNLCGGDYRLDFGFKGVDVNMAAYCSELDMLTPAVTGHILAAELHNQSINSMALVSARHSETSLEILQMMLANQLTASCQAIDLRIARRKILKVLSDIGVSGTRIPWYALISLSPASDIELLTSDLDTRHLLLERTAAVRDSIGDDTWIKEVVGSLGNGTKHLYKYIRSDLKVPFHRLGTPLDRSLSKVHTAIKTRSIDNVVYQIFEKFSDV